MKIKFRPSIAKGKIKPPPSKSQIHRCLIGGGLADGKTVIENFGRDQASDDIKATMACVENLGAGIQRLGDKVIIEGIKREDLEKKIRQKEIIEMPCGESATTLRLLVPICLALGLSADFICKPGLMERPMGEFERLAEKEGFIFSRDGGQYKLRGKISPGTYRVSGQISSQYISGFLMALPILDDDSVLEPSDQVKSRPYIDMTLDIMKEFGINISMRGSDFHIKPSKYRPSTIKAEGDYSSASYLEALNIFGGNVRVEGLDRVSSQADRAYLEFFKMLEKGRPIIDLNSCPDLGPLLFAVAGSFNGATFKGTARLAFKETDRVEKMKENLEKFGIGMDVGEDRVKIRIRDKGSGLMKPGEDLNSYGDHRLAMALSVLLTRTGGCLEGAESVSKSYPNFFRDLKKLGIDLECLEGRTI